MINDIVPKFPPHKIYVEPFFGGGAIFFAKQPSYLEVINDINNNVVNFFQVLKSDTESLRSEIECTLLSEFLHKQAKHIVYNPEGYSEVKRAWAFWMATNFSHSSKLDGGFRFCNGTSGSHSGIVFKNKREFMLKFVNVYARRLEKVQIFNRDALEVLDFRNRPETLAYIDPPYIGADQGHYRGYTQNNLDKLLDLLKNFQGKFILSHYRNKSILDAACDNGWTVELLDKRLSVKKDESRKTEMLVYNFSVPKQSIMNYNLVFDEA